MGSFLCCMKNSSHSEQIQEDGGVVEKPTLVGGGEDGRHEGRQISIKRSNSTLKECLLASPNLNPQHFVNGNEVQVFTHHRHQKAYPHPSSRRIHHVLTSPRTPEWPKDSPNPPQTPQWEVPSLLINHDDDQLLTSPEVRVEFFTPRKSFSSNELVGKLGKVDEKDDEEDDQTSTFTSIMRKGINGSGRMKKKVSFRLPEDDDIYVFYSPMENFEEKC